MAKDRPMRAALLALLYAAGGIFSLLNAAWPMHPESPVALGWLIGVVGVTGAALLWWRATRLTDAEVHAGLVLAAGLVAALGSQSMTAVGVVGLGPIIITICLYAGWFLPLRPRAGTPVSPSRSPVPGRCSPGPTGSSCPG